MHNKGAIFITSKPLLRSHKHYVGAIYITREPYTLLGSHIHYTVFRQSVFKKCE